MQQSHRCNLAAYCARDSRCTTRRRLAANSCGEPTARLVARRGHQVVSYYGLNFCIGTRQYDELSRPKQAAACLAVRLGCAMLLLLASLQWYAPPTCASTLGPDEGALMQASNTFFRCCRCLLAGACRRVGSQRPELRRLGTHYTRYTWAGRPTPSPAQRWCKRSSCSL
jgi:hypothetical protein